MYDVFWNNTGPFNVGVICVFMLYNFYQIKIFQNVLDQNWKMFFKDINETMDASYLIRCFPYKFIWSWFVFNICDLCHVTKHYFYPSFYNIGTELPMENKLDGLVTFSTFVHRLPQCVLGLVWIGIFVQRTYISIWEKLMWFFCLVGYCPAAAKPSSYLPNRVSSLQNVMHLLQMFD